MKAWVKFLLIVLVLLCFVKSSSLGANSQDISELQIGSALKYTWSDPDLGESGTFEYIWKTENSDSYTLEYRSDGQYIHDVILSKTAVDHVYNITSDTDTYSSNFEYLIDPKGLAVGNIVSLHGQNFEVKALTTQTVMAGTFEVWRLEDSGMIRYYEKNNGMMLLMQLSSGPSAISEELIDCTIAGVDNEQTESSITTSSEVTSNSESSTPTSSQVASDSDSESKSLIDSSNDTIEFAVTPSFTTNLGILGVIVLNRIRTKK